MHGAEESIVGVVELKKFEVESILNIKSIDRSQVQTMTG